jgi:hypothetical protein
MYNLSLSERLAVIAAIALAVIVVQTSIPAALGAIEDQSGQVVAEVSQSPVSPVLGANHVIMTFEEDGDLFDGHIRFVLRPEARPLTLMEARIAAQDAFIEALNEPAFADVINRITIVVELVPEAGEGDLKQVFLYESKDGKTWSLSAAQ